MDMEPCWETGSEAIVGIKERNEEYVVQGDNNILGIFREQCIGNIHDGYRLEPSERKIGCLWISGIGKQMKVGVIH